MFSWQHIPFHCYEGLRYLLERVSLDRSQFNNQKSVVQYTSLAHVVNVPASAVDSLKPGRTAASQTTAVFLSFASVCSRVDLPYETPGIGLPSFPFGRGLDGGGL